jgi:threonine dehydrogenase-like Zn-dependent dehydrogenase
MVVHPAQLVPVPDEVTDEQAVLVEPLACAVHAARQVTAPQVAVIGAGALGLLTIAALRELAAPTTLVATAKHPEQRRWAKELGADVVCAPGELDRAVRSATSSFLLDSGQLTSGFPAVVDCVGSETSLSQAIRVVAPAGTVHMVGMPGVTTLDLTPVWQREVALRGVYAYDEHDDRSHDFATALDLVRTLDLGRLVSATYPLSRYEDAVDHAAHAGARGAAKIAFDLRLPRGAR